MRAKQHDNLPQLSAPPHAPDMERSVLGSMLLDQNVLREALNALVPDDFYLDCHKKIFVGMHALASEGQLPDLIMLTDWLRQAGELDDVGGASYLTSLVDVPAPSNWAYHAGAVRRDAKKRRLLDLGLHLTAKAQNGALPDELAAKALADLQLISSLSQGMGAETKRISADALRATEGQDVGWFHFLGQPGIIAPALVTLLSAHAKSGKSTTTAYAVRDIDFASGFLHVRRSMYRGRAFDPKSDHSRRKVVLIPQTRHALHFLRSQVSEQRLAEGLPAVEATDHIFWNPRSPRAEMSVRREFQKNLRRAGLPTIRVHDMRHTFASLLIHQGESPKFIQAQLGHSSIETTFDLYGHLFPEAYEGAATRLQASLFGTDRQPIGPQVNAALSVVAEDRIQPAIQSPAVP